jgi:hypothetical protein
MAEFSATHHRIKRDRTAGHSQSSEGVLTDEPVPGNLSPRFGSLDTLLTPK